jgi:hypothetical protein
MFTLLGFHHQNVSFCYTIFANFEQNNGTLIMESIYKVIAKNGKAGRAEAPTPEEVGS